MVLFCGSALARIASAAPMREGALGIDALGIYRYPMRDGAAEGDDG